MPWLAMLVTIAFIRCWNASWEFPDPKKRQNVLCRHAPFFNCMSIPEGVDDVPVVAEVVVVVVVEVESVEAAVEVAAPAAPPPTFMPTPIPGNPMVE